MKVRAALAGAIALAAATTWAQSPSGSASVDPSLQAAVTKLADAFNAADPKAYANQFATDATLMNPMGQVAHGPAEIEALFAKSAVPVFKGSKSTMTITGTRQITPEVVWLDVDHTVQNAHMPDGKTGTFKPHNVLLAQKQGNDWKWLEMRASIATTPRGRGQSGPAQVRPK